MNRKTTWIVGIILILLLGSAIIVMAANGTLPRPAQDTAVAIPEAETPLATLSVSADAVAWQPQLGYDYSELVLTVSGPDGSRTQAGFPQGETPTFAATTDDNEPRVDGRYTYQLQVIPIVSPEAQATMEAGAIARDPATITQLQDAGLLPPPPYVQSGAFTLQNGAFTTTPMLEESFESQPPSDGVEAPLAQVIAQDLTVQGSICVGLDCINGENFGADTLRLKENNLRIHIQDTSNSGSFPTTDWRLVFNDTTNGGDSYFGVEDATNGRMIFRVDANAPANSLRVDSGGDIGVGTDNPVVEMHMVDGDTPTIRLEQNGSSGFTAQTFDVAANEANFFVRDVTNASKLPFRIIPNAADDALVIKGDNVGLGTDDPTASLYIRKSTPTLEVYNTTAGETTLALNENGNLQLGGLLTEASDRNLKENITAVSPNAVLDRLADVPITTWNYKTESADVTHMGPMAQDFHAAFGLGADDTRIAALDVSGVALAGVQALTAELTSQEDQIADLEAENAALQDQLAGMEARLAQLEAQSTGGGAPVAIPWLWLLAAVGAAALGAFLTLRLRSQRS